MGQICHVLFIGTNTNNSVSSPFICCLYSWVVVELQRPDGLSLRKFMCMSVNKFKYFQLQKFAVKSSDVINVKSFRGIKSRKTYHNHYSNLNAIQKVFNQFTWYFWDISGRKWKQALSGEFAVWAHWRCYFETHILIYFKGLHVLYLSITALMLFSASFSFSVASDLSAVYCMVMWILENILKVTALWVGVQISTSDNNHTWVFSVCLSLWLLVLF